MAVIALIDGEHHPAAVRDALARLDLAGAIFCGGEEKLTAGPLEDHYGMPVETDPEAALRRLAPQAEAVVDLADEPVLPPRAKLRWPPWRCIWACATRRPGCGSTRPTTRRCRSTAPRWR